MKYGRIRLILDIIYMALTIPFVSDKTKKEKACCIIIVASCFLDSDNLREMAEYLDSKRQNFKVWGG